MRAFIILPLVLLAVAVVYSTVNPSGESIGQTEETATPEAVLDVGPTSEATDGELTPDTTPAVDPTPETSLPDGVSGRLTYRTGGDLITVELPSANEVGRVPAPLASAQQASADGEWSMTRQCGDDLCVISLLGADGATTSVRLSVLLDARWSPEGHALAVLGSTETAPGPKRLLVIEDPAAPAPRVVAQEDVAAFSWLGDGRLLFVTPDGEMYRTSLTSGAESFAHLAPTPYLHASPDGRTVAFTQNDAAGWHLWTIDAYDGTLRDLGNMGSDPAGAAPPIETAPEQKGPMYIGWSPDGEYLAFGGGFEPPYIMTTVHIDSGASVRTEFPYGYPGEMKWSPDGTKLAVSSYDVDRTRHESYVVDPNTGVATHLLSGCVIVWSPDSRFLAVHGEPDPGIGIVDIATGAQGKLTHERNDIPIAWSP